MARFILGRVAQFPLILAVIYLTTFMLAWVAPGDPFSSEKSDPQTVAALKERYNVDSAWSFLGTYPLNLLKGEMGPSFNYEGEDVQDIIGDTLPVSITVGTFSIIIAAFFGIGIGTLAAVRRGGVLDYLSLTIALIGVSVPSFVIASTLLSAFAYNTSLLPLGGWPRVGYGEGPFFEVTFEYLRHMLLPAIALSLLPMAYITRLTRVSMIDVVSSDYVRTARAKGVSKLKVIFKHCLRNALLPVLSFLGPATANVLVGSFVIETIFDLPGLGEHFVKSVVNRDQPLILGTVMIYSTLLLLLNLVVDLLYGVIDPRISVTGGST